MGINCKVCGVSSATSDVKWRNGAVVCSACVSFYRNNIDGGYLTFVCRTGDNNCFDNSEVADSAVVCSNGRVWRFACASCRFAKCAKIGLKFGGKRKCRSSSVSSPETTMELAIPNEFDTKLKQVVGLLDQYKDYCQNESPGVTRKFTNIKEIVNIFRDNMQGSTNRFSILIKNAPGFKNIQLDERCAMFGPSLGRINMMTLALSDNPVGVHLNEENFQIVLKNCPQFPIMVCLDFSLQKKKSKKI